MQGYHYYAGAVVMTVTHSKRKISESSVNATSTSPSNTNITDSTNSNIPIPQEIGIRYSCDNCYIDITNIPRIQCAICTEEIDLCIQCFSEGVSFDDHLPTHSYRILKPLDFPIFTPSSPCSNSDSDASSWKAEEELLLLESLEQYGMGNWDEIGESISSKTSEQCYHHYFKVYLPGHYPSMIWSQRQECAFQSLPANHEITGYMPNREEFETEWENESELFLKDLSFNEATDSPTDIRLKLSILQIYNECLDRRDARIHFSINYGMINFKKHQNSDKMRGKEEKEIYNNLKPFARFLPSIEFQELLEGLVKEEELRRRLSQLQEWRRLGLRDPNQVSIMDGERKHLELYLKGGGTIFSRSSASNNPTLVPFSSFHSHYHGNQNSFGNGSAGGMGNFTVPIKKLVSSSTIPSQSFNSTNSSSGVACTFSTPFLGLVNSAFSSSSSPFFNIGNVKGSGGGGGIENGNSEEWKGDARERERGERSNMIGNVISNSALVSHPHLLNYHGNGNISNSHSHSFYHHSGGNFSPINGIGANGTIMPISSNSPSPNSIASRKASTPLNISHADGVELLSERERHLCSILRLYPRLYLSIKENLIRESMRMGGLKRAQARAAVKIDVNKTSKLYDFFIAAGWIKAPPSGE